MDPVVKVASRAADGPEFGSLKELLSYCINNGLLLQEVLAVWELFVTQIVDFPASQKGRVAWEDIVFIFTQKPHNLAPFRRTDFVGYLYFIFFSTYAKRYDSYVKANSIEYIAYKTYHNKHFAV